MANPAKVFTMAVLLMAVYCTAGKAQAVSPAILVIDVENAVVYTYDTPDVSKFATDPNIATPLPARNFLIRIVVGDIVAVNGKLAKGLYAARATDIGAQPVLSPGRAIADITRAIVEDDYFEILRPDGTPIGTLMTEGLGTGAPPPGAPVASANSNFAIVGGTGAFLGSRGQAEYLQVVRRFASVTEDPANRRTLGGAPRRFVLHLLPMFRPEVILTQGFPTVTHANGVLTAAQPARAGELLSIFATGLGPTRPGVDPSQPFSADPPQVVNSPLVVTVNGQPAEVLSAVGVPGSVDTYQIDFRLPDGLGPGFATIQITEAFIPGPTFQIPVW